MPRKLKYVTEDYTDIEHLHALLFRGVLEVAPAKTERHGTHWQVTVGIGPDHVAYVTLDEDAYRELDHIIATLPCPSSPKTSPV